MVVNRCIVQTKKCFSQRNFANIIQYTYWVIHKLWIIGLGSEIQQNRSATEKSIRLVTNSTYFAHTTALFKSKGLLKVYNIFKLKLLKFFYKLSYDLLPPYFNSYHAVIDRKPPRVLRQHFIHQPMIKRVYTECTPLYQLIKLLNMMRNDPTDSILNKISENNQSYV